MSGLALEEYELLEDPKYRHYVAAVDKALRNFENTSEWADLISTLGKLNKVLLSHMKYPVVPRRIVISKRLAQCLHPALPSGVHLKALEIYDIIFKCMGTNRLSQELFIYSAGLFPLFGSAAMNVRSALLMIYETHFVPLGNRLRPGLNGFLSAVLSGLEEGSDHLERTSLLLQRVAEGVGKLEFFGCLWECILNNSGVRLPAITHITSCFNKKLSTEDQLYILGTNIDIMVHGLCRALEDNTVLVQRAALDLTLLLLPMHNTQLLRSDLISIVASSLLVLLRRDMSLNRRLFAWLLGSEVNLSILPSEHPVLKRLGSCEGSLEKGENTNYFDAFSKSLLVEAFIILLKMASSDATVSDVRPCRIIIPLLDKPEIGPDILDLIFVDFLRYLYYTCNHLHPPSDATCQTKDAEGKLPKDIKSTKDAEINKTAMLVFSALQPCYPWQRLLILLTEAFQNILDEENDRKKFEDNSVVHLVGSTVIEVAELFKLMNFLFKFLPLESEQQIEASGVSELLSSVLNLLTERVDLLMVGELSTGLELYKAVLEKLIPSVMQKSSFSQAKTDSQGSVPTPTFHQLQIPNRITEFCSNVPLENGIIQIGIEANEKGKAARPSIKPNLSNLFNQEKFALPTLPPLAIQLNKSENAETSKDDLTKDDDKTDIITTSKGELDGTHCSSYKSCANYGTLPEDTVDCRLNDSFELDLQSDSNDLSDECEETFDSAPENVDYSESSSLYKHVKGFQKFFHRYFERRIIGSGDVSLSRFENLLFNQIADSSTSDLKHLLKECVSSCSYEDSEQKMQFSPTKNGMPVFNEITMQALYSFAVFRPVTDKEMVVFKIACGILVDLSSMPATPDPISPFVYTTKTNLPSWLLSLLLCVVSGNQISPAFTQTAISTLLELVALSQSDLSVWRSRSQLNAANSVDEGVTSLQILPLLSSSHTNILLCHTYIFQFIAVELWSHLNIEMKSYHISATELLLQVHNLSLMRPTSSCFPCLYTHSVSVVEKEILKTLSSTPTHTSHGGVKWSVMPSIHGTNSASIGRWITLWQVSRNLYRGSCSSLDGFNRCLFLMVERLFSNSAEERSFAHSWLDESLNCGDLARIMDPVLVFLLHPHTRRISVQHVNIKKLLDNTEISNDDSIEAHIYAISSVKGEVIYHISKQHSANRAKTSSNAVLSSLKKQIISLAPTGDDYRHKYVTQQVNLENYEVPIVPHDINGAAMSLMINPFSQHPWIDINDLAKLSKTHLGMEKVSSRPRSSSLKKAKENPKWSSKDIAESILEEILDRVVTPKFESDFNGCSSPHEKAVERLPKDKKKEATLHPLHSHMLLYVQLVDASQCLYSLNLIRNILEAQPKQFLLSLASTSVTPHQKASPLLVLLGQHRRSVFGEGFDGGDLSEMTGQLRSAMYLQVVITVCLYYIRSYYSRQPHLRIQEEHLKDNRELQVVAADVLDALFAHLIPLVTASPRGFSPYIKDLLNKCKVQKCVLHCLLSTILVLKEREGGLNSSNEDKTFSEDVLEYNFSSLHPRIAFLSHEQPYLFSLMNLTLSLMKLEDVLLQSKVEPLPKDLESGYSPGKTQSITALRYILGRPISCQPMFQCALLLALNEKGLKYYHTSWLRLFTSSLPHMGSSLPLNCLRIMNVLCGILEELSSFYSSRELPAVAPSDYTLHILTGLTNIVHFCLLEPSQTQTNSSTQSSTTSVGGASSANQSAGQILYNLLHVFSPAGDVLDASLDMSAVDPLIRSRKTLLSHLPRLVSSLLCLWLGSSEDDKKESYVLGSRQSVRQHIIELLSPVCHHHTPHLLAALSVVWQSSSEDDLFHLNNSLRSQSSIWSCSPQQRALVEILSTLRVLPLHSLVENVKQVFKYPPVVEGGVQKIPLEVSVLQLFYLYVKETAATNQLSVCWGPLLALVKEGILCLPPPALLVLLASLNEFIQRAPAVQDKKEIRELQDVAAKLLDAVSTIAGSRLEATTWLRRNLTVRTELDDVDVSSNSSFSVAALRVLAELLAPMLDVLYASEEKEKVIPLLMSIMGNVIPYLRNHSNCNMGAFHACSQLLSSLSGYQYTLKAWRKDVLDLLLDNHTFKMLPETLPYWRTLVDNLCTHDKSVFKELLGKISISQSGSLNLFTSKESEYENCAGLLKRLSFTIFCSETDQYLKLIPDIQERLTEVTRLGQVVPGLVAQVLLCFRVLLLRISPRGTTSLWPIIITELVQVLLLMEQELSTDSEQFSKKNNSSHLKRLSTLDYRWIVGAHNGLHAHNHPAWLSLYLAACKLLDLMLALPASLLPQFQMYRWAFVGSSIDSPPSPELEKKSSEWSGCYLLKSCRFVPHLSRIARLMSQKIAPSTLPTNKLTSNYDSGDLFLTTTSISTLLDLQPFFIALTSNPSHSLTPPPDGPQFRDLSSPSCSTDLHFEGTNLARIEAVIGRDFLEPLVV